MPHTRSLDQPSGWKVKPCRRRPHVGHGTDLRNDLFDDRQRPEVGIELPHPLAGTVALVANPIRLSASPVRYERAPPTLGQHTDEVLTQWLGLDDAAIAGLHKRDVL